MWKKPSPKFKRSSLLKILQWLPIAPIKYEAFKRIFKFLDPSHHTHLLSLTSHTCTHLALTLAVRSLSSQVFLAAVFSFSPSNGSPTLQEGAQMAHPPQSSSCSPRQNEPPLPYVPKGCCVCPPPPPFSYLCIVLLFPSPLQVMHWEQAPYSVVPPPSHPHLHDVASPPPTSHAHPACQGPILAPFLWEILNMLFVPIN